jgi:hypothetical protein
VQAGPSGLTSNGADAALSQSAARLIRRVGLRARSREREPEEWTAIEMSRVCGATGLFVIVGVLYWWTVFLAMHVLEPEFSPLTAPGSAYVLGNYGAWMTTTYFVLGAVLLSADLGLTTNVAVTALTRIGSVAFLIAGPALCWRALFRWTSPASADSVRSLARPWWFAHVSTVGYWDVALLAEHSTRSSVGAPLGHTVRALSSQHRHGRGIARFYPF